MAPLPDDAIVMHPGPMNRGVEIAAEVADSPRSTIVEQVTNGVSVRMAVLYLLLAGGTDRQRRRGGDGMSSWLIKGVRVLGGEPSDLVLADGIVAALEPGGPPRRPPRRARRCSTATVSSPCPGWSTCTPTCGSPAARTPRRSRPAPGRRALGGYTAVHAMANTDPVADTAGVVEQVWQLGQAAGHCDVHPVGAVDRRPGRASSSPSSARWPTAPPASASSPTTAGACRTRC